MGTGFIPNLGKNITRCTCQVVERKRGIMCLLSFFPLNCCHLLFYLVFSKGVTLGISQITKLLHKDSGLFCRSFKKFTNYFSKLNHLQAFSMSSSL